MAVLAGRTQRVLANGIYNDLALVPGITDNDDYLRLTREFIKGLSNVKRIDVFPYHSLGIYKWDELGIPYTLRDTKPPAVERVRNAERILQGAGDATR